MTALAFSLARLRARVAMSRRLRAAAICALLGVASSLLLPVLLPRLAGSQPRSAPPVPPTSCLISEGLSIGGLRVGMTAAQAFALTGPPTGRRLAGADVTYTLRPPWSRITVRGETVRSVATQSSRCRNQRGLGPGSTLSEVQRRYPDQLGSLVPATDGEILRYPFLGIAFTLRQGRVVEVIVFRPDAAVARALPMRVVPWLDPSAPLGSRQNPVAVGQRTTVTTEDPLEGFRRFAVTLLRVVRGSEAWELIQRANRFNPPPRAGYEYFLTLVRVEYLQGRSDRVSTIGQASFRLLSGQSRSFYERFVAAVPPDPALGTSLFPGGYTEGWMAWEIVSGDFPLLGFGVRYDGSGGTWFKTWP